MGREDLKEEVKETFCGEERQSGVGARQRVSEEATQRSLLVGEFAQVGKGRRFGGTGRIHRWRREAAGVDLPWSDIPGGIAD
jgi:hypothetical protein